MVTIAGPGGSLQRGGPLATISQIYTNQNVANDPGFFESLLGRAEELGKKGQAKYAAIGGTKAVAGKYMPLLGVGLSLASDPTNIGGAAGTGIGGVLGAGLGAAVGGPLAPITSLAGSAIGSAIGGGIGGALQQGLVGGTKAVVDAVTGARREEGKSGLFGGGVGDLDAGKINELAKSLGMTQVEVAEKLVPSYNAMRNADVNRQMQLNQQLGQLTGALNQQKYMAQLAGGAQSEAGATTRSILTAANPYAQSAFQYRG
jgi:hypothetical protein